MAFPLNTILFDFLVLSIVAGEDSYGYQISQIIKQVSDTKDSALYPVLKRLQEKGFVDTYDRQIQGRNRKYYRITAAGRKQQQLLASQWEDYKLQIDLIVKGGTDND